MREAHSTKIVHWRMSFLGSILKVQLAKETDKKEGLPRERTFTECAQEMVDVSAREEDSRMETDEGGWRKVTYTRPRSTENHWRRREYKEAGRDRGTAERKLTQVRPRNVSRKEERRCHGCGKMGHLVARCPRTRCFECGNEGHIAKHCPYIYRRREVDQGEPMEINVQRVRRGRGSQRSEESSSETSEASEASETEIEDKGRKRTGEMRSGRKRVGVRRRSYEEI
ncbi:uncharacterized protein [Halyomorpha halys]|uniref:uncharacterized protein n=1 Tax=Halyomorpha halys TaxID=286706 RepID=UPI0006D4FCBF|nr:uncharacterized protein LOC106689616 [Halyomorpha halys]